MFTINQSDMPVLPHRHALLVLDLQNDLVSPGCLLPVERPEDLVGNIMNLASEFRDNGKVVWVRSQFESHRSINTGAAASEDVITNAEFPVAPNDTGAAADEGSGKGSGNLNVNLKDGQDSAEFEAAPYTRTLDEEETFLTVVNGTKPKIMVPLSTGSNYCTASVPFIKPSNDIFFSKSHYSAFKTGSLLQALRGQFVTELYICGALTNISIFATAMDAAMYGYHITLVSDCCGYRSQARHDEALRRLEEATGCDIFTAAEVLEQRRSSREKKQPRDVGPANSGRDTKGFRQTLSTMRNSHGSSSRTSRGSTSSPSKVTSASTRERTSHKPIDTPASSVSQPQAQPVTSKNNPQIPKGFIEVEDEYVADGLKQSAPITARVREASICFDEDNATHESSNAILVADEDDSYDLPPVLIKHEKPLRVLNKVKVRSRVAKTSHNHSSEASMRSDPPSDTTLAAATEALEAMSLSNGKGPDAISLKMNANNSKEETEPGTMVDPTSGVLAGTRAHQSPSVSQISVGYGSSKPASDSKVDPVTVQDKEENTLCEGDTKIIENLLDEAEAATVFERIRNEVQWQNMSHLGGEVPRLVAVQGEANLDGSIPVYRHPSDESPPLLSFTKAVSEVKHEVERALGHKVNHCLIQLYRDGTDYISEHSDKTLDIDPNSYIANVSLGATRTMTFRTKRPRRDASSKEFEPSLRQTERALLPHNSLCRMGLATNSKWLHSIRADKRRLAEKSPGELSYNGQRISLTFRLISTFLTSDFTHIYGQGATSKTAEAPSLILHGQSHREHAEAMIMAFGIENQSSYFDWNKVYGTGFDILHMTNTTRLFLSPSDSIANLKIRLMLHEYNVPYTIAFASVPDLRKDGNMHIADFEALPIRFVDNNNERTCIDGDTAIAVYIETFYGPGSEREAISRRSFAKELTRMERANYLKSLWQAKQMDATFFRKTLRAWNSYAEEEQDGFIAGKTLGLADYSLWPVLREVVKNWGWEKIKGEEEIALPALKRYCERMGEKESVIALLKELETEKKSVME